MKDVKKSYVWVFKRLWKTECKADKEAASLFVCFLVNDERDWIKRGMEHENRNEKNDKSKRNQENQ